MEFVKKNKYTIILLLIFGVLVFLGFKVVNLLVPDDEKASYGERIKDIDEHPIAKEIYEKVEEEYKKNSNVKKVSYRLQGKIINYFITIDDKVSVKDAKTIGENLITYLGDDIVGYYSVQIYMLKEDEKQNNFPIIGMKDPLSKSVSWTKDREIVVESDENEEEK